MCRNDNASTAVSRHQARQQATPLADNANNHRLNSENSSDSDSSLPSGAALVLSASGPRGGRPITKAELAQHCTATDCWVSIEGRVYDMTKWLAHHPGGELVIVNLAGQDATEPFLQFHPYWVWEKKLHHFYKGDLVEHTPSAFQRDLRALSYRLEKLGMFQTDYRYYVGLALWIGTLLAAALCCVLLSSSTAVHMLGAVLLAFFLQQSAFVGHDLGHNGVSHNRFVDMSMGLVMGDLLTGISLSWWKRSHNVHHVVTNSVDYDPDIQHLPIIAVSKDFFKSVFSHYHGRRLNFDAFSRFIVQYQHYLFYVYMAFARFNLYLQSFILLLSKERLPFPRVLEFLAISLHWVAMGSLIYAVPPGERLAFFMLSQCIAGITLNTQICLSHMPMPTYEGRPYQTEQQDWFRTQLATTLNIECWPINDWFHGGLHFQIEHHLFPRIPRHNLRKVMPFVKQFCAEHNVEYNSASFLQANVSLIKCLAVCAKQAQLWRFEI